MLTNKKIKPLFLLSLFLMISCLCINSIKSFAAEFNPLAEPMETTPSESISEEIIQPEDGVIISDTSDGKRIFLKYVRTPDLNEESSLPAPIPPKVDMFNQDEVIPQEEYPELTVNDSINTDYTVYVPKPEDYILEYINQDKETVSEEVYESFQPEDTVSKKVYKSSNSRKTVNKEVYASYEIKNKGGLYTAGFSPKPDKEFLKFTHKNSSLEISPVNHSSVTGKVYGNSITYENIYPNTDIRYTLQERSLKEEIIVQQFTGQTEFNFELSVSNAVYSPRSNGLILFTDLESGEILYYMAKPFAVDKNGERCDLLTLEFSEDGILKLTIDSKWLKNAAYPITIDPTIYLPNATFTRSSTAYMQNGTQIAANVPRYETGSFGQAVMVEEGTTPLVLKPFFSNHTGTLNDGVQDTFTNWSKYVSSGATGRNEAVTGDFGGVALKITQTDATDSGKYYGVCQVRTLTDLGLFVGDVISAKVRYKMSAQTNSSVRIFIQFRDSSNVAIGSNKVIVNATGAVSEYNTASLDAITIPENTYSVRFYATIRSSASYSSGNNQLWVDYFCCEEKAYSTSPNDVTRNAETLTVLTAGIFNKGNWATELTFTPTSTQVVPGKTGILWRCIINSSNEYCISINSSGKLYGTVYSSGTSYSTGVTNSPVLAPGNNYYITFTGDGSKIRLYVNGVQVGSDTSYVEPVGTLPTNMYIGSNQSGGQHCNGLIDDFRISDRARTLAEHQAAYNSGQALPVDSNTTCKINFDKSLKVGAYGLYDVGVESYFNYNTASLGGGWGAAINTYNLNLIVSKNLFSIPGRGLPIGESITYNSIDDRSGTLGVRWRLGSDSSITERQDGKVVFNEGDGSSHTFIPNTNGYSAPHGIYLTLEKISTGNFKITDKYQNVYNYQNGLPSQFVDRHGNTTTFSYDTNGRLYQQIDPSGRAITYAYNTNGLVSSITDPASRTYQFNYNNNNLTTIIDPDNKIFSLGYDTNGHLRTFTDPLNRVTTFIINTGGKLQKFRDARTSGQDIYETVYTTSSGNVTTVVDPGTHTSYFYHNSNGNLTKYTDPLGHIWNYTWSLNKMTYRSDAETNTSYTYDNKGNVTKTKINMGDGIYITNSMHYNEFSQLYKSYDGESRVTYYNHDEKGDLFSVNNSDMTECKGLRYDQYGNMIEYNSSVSINTNRLKNGNMEIAGTGGELLADWTCSGGTATATLDGSYAPYGRSSLKISSNTYTTKTFSQSSNVATYDCLTLRADVKLAGVVPSGSNGGAVIKIRWRDDYWESLYCWGDGEFPLVLTHEVDKYTSAVEVYIGLENAKGTVWFDGVQLERVEWPALVYNLSSFSLVENGGFDKNLAHWNYTGVQPGISSPVSDYNLGGACINHTTNRTSTIYQDVPVHGGELLTFSGMVFTHYVTGKGAYFKVEFYDSSNNQVGDTLYTGTLNGKKDFTRLSCIADAPLQASYARVTAVFEGTGIVYLDAVKLVHRNSTKYVYNQAGNYVTIKENALGYQESYTYNENIGTLESSTDALNHTTNYYYDNLNRLNEVTDPLNNSAYYGYDDVSNIITTRDTRSASQTDSTYLTQYGYNNINQLDALTDPLNRISSTTFDRCGNLTSVTLPNGMQTTYTYDAAHRLTRKTLQGGKYYDYTYDDANRLIGVVDQDNNSYTWGYDRANRVLYTIDNTYRIDYEWDKSHNLKKENNILYGYGNDNKLLYVKPLYYYEFSYRYDENGRIFQIKKPAWAYRNITYYPNGWCKSIQDPGFPDSDNFLYSYYNDGNISEIKSGTGKENFYYDNNGRLVRWDLNDVTQENYSYDAAGNLLTKGSKTYTYNNANQITNQGFTYDNNGNLTCDGTYKYAYDSENHLVEVRKFSDNSLVATYSYNHDGLRKSKTVYTGSNPVTTNFYWDALGRLVKGDRSYIYDNSGNLVAILTSEYYKVNTNLRGDVVSITNENGGLVASYKYDPWGKIISSTGTFSQSFRYAGYYYDSETGLYYCKNRYYSPKLGRFLTKDSISYIKYEDPETINLYIYARNNPIAFIDTNGNLYARKVEEGGGIAVSNNDAQDGDIWLSDEDWCDLYYTDSIASYTIHLTPGSEMSSFVYNQIEHDEMVRENIGNMRPPDHPWEVVGGCIDVYGGIVTIGVGTAGAGAVSAACPPASPFAAPSITSAAWSAGSAEITLGLYHIRKGWGN